ncbi:MAG TPA: ATP-binding cassette domain-containing protein, partial [Candidatus Limnocylindrales bacterium]|nr:ATP-binding cassette domain-containing protein [Candidatus Limnocylindrales bacterium]
MTDPLIQLEGVSKRYGSGDVAVDALKDVSLTIGSGELVVVLGPSGSGKTTLLNLIGGIEPVTSGELTVAGRSLVGNSSDDLTTYRRETVGFVFQFFNLVPTLTALENVQLVAELEGSAPEQQS